MSMSIAFGIRGWCVFVATFGLRFCTTRSQGGVGIGCLYALLCLQNGAVDSGGFPLFLNYMPRFDFVYTFLLFYQIEFFQFFFVIFVSFYCKRNLTNRDCWIGKLIFAVRSLKIFCLIFHIGKGEEWLWMPLSNVGAHTRKVNRYYVVIGSNCGLSLLTDIFEELLSVNGPNLCFEVCFS